MKHTLAGLFTLALALPLLADEAKKPAEPTPQDSPLVAAAKRANRLGKKPASKVVITNETLKTAGTNAHVTTTQSQGTLATAKLPPPAPTPEMVRAKQLEDQRVKEAEAAAAKQKVDDQRAKRIRAAAEMAEEEYPDDVDPAEAEKDLTDANAKKPPR